MQPAPGQDSELAKYPYETGKGEWLPLQKQGGGGVAEEAVVTHYS